MLQRSSRFCLAVALAGATAADGGVHAQGAPVASAADTTPAGLSIGSWRHALELLRRHQPELGAAKAAVQTAQAALDAAVARRLPRFEAVAGAEYGAIRPAYGDDLEVAQHRVFPADGLVPRASATVAVEFSLSAWSTRDSAEAGLAAAEAERGARVHALRQQLAAALLAVVAARRVEQRASAGLAAALERRELVQRMQTLGRANQLDELRFVNDVHDAEASLIEARRALAVTKTALGEALGVGTDVELAASFDAESVRAGVVDRDCTQIASLAERPEVAAAGLRVEEAKRAATATAYEALPELRVQTSYLATHRPSSAVTFEGERQLLHDWTAGVDLVWSIWDGGARAAELDRRRAETANRRAEVSAASRGAVRLARLAAQRSRLAADQLRLAEQRYEAARTTDELTRRAFELGSASALESVDAAGQLRRASIEVALRQVEHLGTEAAERLWWARCN